MRSPSRSRPRSPASLGAYCRKAFPPVQRDVRFSQNSRSSAVGVPASSACDLAREVVTKSRPHFTDRREHTMLSQEAMKQYRQKGWLVVNDIFSRDEAEKIATLALQISTEELKNVKG